MLCMRFEMPNSRCGVRSWVIQWRWNEMLMWGSPTDLEALLGDPIRAFGQVTGEVVQRRLRYGERHRDVCQVNVTLQGIAPPIWRRILIPSAFRLDRSHLVIQGAFGWNHSHLHIFRAGGKAFEAIYESSYEQEGQNETQVGLYDLLMMGGGSAEYVYDFGDHWQHVIRLEERTLSEQPRGPSCIAGERACPPEDVGGVGGYERMLKVLGDPADDEYESFIEWLPENYDPEAFSVESANERIQDMLTYRG